MTAIRDLQSFIGRIATVQVDIPEDEARDETYEEVTGKVLAAGAETGIVIQTKAGARIIRIEQILDIERAPADGKVVRRWLEHVDVDSVRQHLADRHGVFMPLVRGLTPAAALELHSKTNHGPLGHDHGVKPRRVPSQPTGQES